MACVGCDLFIMYEKKSRSLQAKIAPAHLWHGNLKYSSFLSAQPLESLEIVWTTARDIGDFEGFNRVRRKRVIPGFPMAIYIFSFVFGNSRSLIAWNFL